VRQLRQLQSGLLQSGLLQPSFFQHSLQQPVSLLPALSRGISASPAAHGLEEFFDTPGKDNAAPTAGRSWKAQELRSKSWDDLHKLWYVLLKERNMLQSEKLRARAANARLQNPFRLTKVRKSMSRIKHVLNERVIAETDPEKARALKYVIDAI
jgi:large subunit ribosomal protein L47